MNKVLSVSDLHTHFHTDKGVIPAVSGVDFSIPKGKTLGIVGESGCGKSVTSLSVLQLLPKLSGRILEKSKIEFMGQNLLDLKEKEMAKVRGNRISMIFQEPMTSLNPVLTIGQQVAEPLVVHGLLEKKNTKEKVVSLLKIVGIPDPVKRLGVYPHQLSGGLRQRVMIAMALSCDPDLLIADEPTTALDVTIQAQIVTLLKELQEKNGMAILYISHNLGVIAEICDHVNVMYTGRIVESADVFTLFSNPLHPYTKGLMRAVPGTEKPVRRLYNIRGMVPHLLSMPKGCPFSPRCDSAMDICAKKEPPIVYPGKDHGVRCFLFQESRQ